MTLPVLLVLGTVAAAIAVFTTAAIYRRPQRGLLILAALTPLHGLLGILPLPGIAAGWKEGLLILTAVCAWLRRARTPVPHRRAPLHVPW